jgi:flagellar biosynthetic protein FliR
VNECDALVFARCAGFIFRAPGFSHPSVPPPLRAGFAFALALACAHGCAGSHGHGMEAARSSSGAVTPVSFVAALVAEFALGAALGVAASMLYDGAYSGGRMLDDYTGIRASVPGAGIGAGAGFGRLWSLAFSAGFFVLGGYRIALDAFARTFAAIPAGALVEPGSLRAFALTLPATLLRAALLVAGPGIVVALVAQIALAGIARIAPRLQTFALSFPIVFGCVLAVTLLGFAAVLPRAAEPWFAPQMLRAR